MTGRHWLILAGTILLLIIGAIMIVAYSNGA